MFEVDLRHLGLRAELSTSEGEFKVGAMPIVLLTRACQVAMFNPVWNIRRPVEASGLWIIPNDGGFVMASISQKRTPRPPWREQLREGLKIKARPVS